ncbi:hypothetical protein JRQ81_003317, partial [Phrynocephalus forsythii]
DKKPNKVYWKYRDRVIIKYTDGRIFKDDKTAAYTFVDAYNGDYSLRLLDAKEGQYTCKVEENELKTYDLTVWKIKGPQEEYCLQGETLTLSLEQHAPLKKRTKLEVKWISPHKVHVKGQEPRWQLQNNNWDLHIENLVAEEDNGTWECHIPLEDGLKVPYNVKVIGFSNVLDNKMFAVINSSVTLSCPLNVNLKNLKTLGNILPYGEWMKDNMTLVKGDISNSTLTSSLVKEIPNVQFEDAGRYQCNFKFGSRQLNKFIQLVVMKVAPRVASEEGNETLCCHISAPAPPAAKLCWVHAKETSCSHGSLKSPFCHPVTTTGLWRCDLKVKNEVKISINHSEVKEEATGRRLHAFPLAEAVSGAGVTLLLLVTAGIIGPACRTIRRKRQQLKRMAQAKQHLLAKRTCQCWRQERKCSAIARELTNDYHHT